MKSNYVTTEEIKALERNNKELLRSSLQCWVFFSIVFFACHVFEGQISSFSLLVADFVPSIKKIAALEDPISKFAATYFSMGIFTMPIGLAIVSIHQDMRLRLSVGIKRHLTKARGFAAVYLVGLPFFLFVLSFYFWLPINIASPRLWGQQVIHLIIASQPGMLFLGSFSLMVLAYVILIIVSMVIYPFHSLAILILKQKYDAK